MSVLREALEQFGRQRSAVISAAIEQLGASAVYPPIVQRKNLDFHRAWLTACREPEARTWCLEHLLKQLPKLIDGKEHSSGDTCEALDQRIKALLELPPDPRIARAMLDQFVLDAPVIGFVDVAKNMAKALVANADDGTASRVESLDFWGAKYLAKAKWPKRVVLSADDERRWQALAPRAAANVDELWREVLASPDDDVRLEVLADALLESGNPRGEFITLQLKEARGHATAADLERIRTLTKDHGKKWLEELRPIFTRAEFRRGLLSWFELGGKWNAPDKVWPKLAQSPWLASVGSFDAGKAKGEITKLFITSPAMRSLDTVTISSGVEWDALVSAPPPKLTTVCCFGWARRDPQTRFFERVVPWVIERPAITGLGCDRAWLEQLPQTLARRIKHLRLSWCEQDDAFELWGRYTWLERLEITGTDPLEFVRTGRSTTLTIRPSTFFAASAFSGSLPKDVKRVIIEGNAAWAKRSEGRFGQAEVIERALPSGLVTGVK